MSASGRRHVVVPFTHPAEDVSDARQVAEARAFVAHQRPAIGLCQECGQPLELEDDRFAGGCLNERCEAWLQARDLRIWQRITDGAETRVIAREFGMNISEAGREVVRVCLGEPPEPSEES